MIDNAFFNFKLTDRKECSRFAEGNRPWSTWQPPGWSCLLRQASPYRPTARSQTSPLLLEESPDTAREIWNRNKHQKRLQGNEIRYIPQKRVKARQKLFDGAVNSSCFTIISVFTQSNAKALFLNWHLFHVALKMLRKYKMYVKHSEISVGHLQKASEKCKLCISGSYTIHGNCYQWRGKAQCTNRSDKSRDCNW